MSNINIRKKFIFIHVPKTGGVSMESVDWNRTDRNFYKGHFTIQDFIDYGIDIKKYFKWCFVRNPWDRLLSAYDYSELLKKQFTTFEQLVETIYKYKSCYTKLNVKWEIDKDGIPNLLLNTPRIFLYNQLSLITHNDINQMDFVGRFERINEDWKHVCEKIKELDINKKYPDEKWELPIKNARKANSIQGAQYKQKPFQEYYTEDTKNMVAEIYKNDILAFNYKF